MLYKQNVDDLYICPKCQSEIISLNNLLFCSNQNCYYNKINFNYIYNKPVLINFDNSIVSSENLFKIVGTSSIKRKNGYLAKLRNLIQGTNEITRTNVEFIIDLLNKIDSPKILIIGGGEIGSGIENLYIKYSKNITSFDIYNSENVDFIADAHSIPLKSKLFDLVVIQAVLEHVIEPHKVVNEIERVLKFGGIIYSETPFIQQVHEGPYDFTRYTESGHRYLFKNFELLKSGFVSGCGSALIWSLSAFFTGLFRSKIAGKIIRILFFWVRYFDNIISFSNNIDGACGVFFLGKNNNNIMSNIEMIHFYNGNQRVDIN